MPYQYKVIDWDLIDKYISKYSGQFIAGTFDRLSFVLNYLASKGSWELVESTKDRSGKPIFIFKRSSALTTSEQDDDEIRTERSITDIEMG